MTEIRNTIGYFDYVIPAKVVFSKLRPEIILLYGRITTLCNEKGECIYNALEWDVIDNYIPGQNELHIKALIDKGFIGLYDEMFDEHWFACKDLLGAYKHHYNNGWIIHKQ